MLSRTVLVTLNYWLSVSDGSSEICDKSWCVTKVGVDRKVKSEENAKMNYIVADEYGKKFTRVNFIDNPALFPDSPYFTMGSYIKNRNALRPFRVRMCPFKLNFDIYED